MKYHILTVSTLYINCNLTDVSGGFRQLSQAEDAIVFE